MSHSLLQLIFVFALFLAIAAVIKVVLRRKARGAQNYPYEKEKALFSPAERSFLGVLEQAGNDRYRFMGKVRLADVLKVKGGLSKSNRQNAFNRIQSKHVDIVACDPATMNIKFVIELDDSTHSQPIRQDRDRFLDNAFEAAGIPIIHVTAKKAYSIQDIQGILSQGRPERTAESGYAANQGERAPAPG
jgi:very-short-patch-repair endonuclease